MEDIKYYQAFTEKIFFKGIKAEEVPIFSRYRSGKSFHDLNQALLEGRLEGLGKFEHEVGCIAGKIYEVLEIETEAFDKAYGKLD